MRDRDRTHWDAAFVLLSALAKARRHEGMRVRVPTSLMQPGREVQRNGDHGKLAIPARRAYLAARVPALAALVLVAGSGIAPARADATVFTETKLTASDGADAFGFSTAVDGDTLVVGARGSAVDPSGAAYVFIRNGEAWIEEAKLIPSDGAFTDQAGESVGLSGDTAIVGAPRNDTGGDESGAAYVFVRNAGVWTQEAKLTAVDAAAGDLFGYSVAISGNTAVVGRSTQNDDPAVGAYVFTRSGTTWTQEAKLTASDGVPFEAFGAAVAVSGDTVVVGNPFHDDGVFPRETGAAYVFVRNAGVWTEEAQVLPNTSTEANEFGHSVSIDGDTAAIGAPGDRDAADFSGAAYVFIRSAGVWTLEAKLKASDPEVDDNLGHAIAISGDDLVAGALGDDDNGSFSGAAYVFTRSGGVWMQDAKLTAIDGSRGLGFSVSINAKTIVAGAHQNAGGGNAYVFAPGSPGPTPPGTATATPTATVTAAATLTAIVSTVTPTATAVPACAATPIAGCRTPAVGQKALLLIKDKSPDDKDLLFWKWIKGSVTANEDFGAPLTTTNYQLCIYDGTPTKVLDAAIPAGGFCNAANPKPCWQEKRTGFTYKDKDATPEGITKMTLKEGLVAGKAKVILKGKGAFLDDPSYPIAQPVTVQLLNGTTCWEAKYSAPAIKNIGGPAAQFRDKGD